MNRTKITVAALAASLLAGPALAHDCTGRIDEFERLLDTAAEQAISASSGGQAVAGAREAQAIEDTERSDVVPVQETEEEVEAVEDADEAGNGGEKVIEARAALQQARELAEEGDDAACAEAVDEVILTLLEN
ncbi:MAG: hypothetical protein ACJASC_002127 [Limimaricola cinnabarinus]|jgi:hypothetical protein|uniref:Uncharacterized protein n=1 Tax=Limimaricola cinnabarinus LL-001 TaxID=1337093 RepID=U3AQ24_9RHOB|nr:hypothetical protein [Limimaricola cinnabarinus]GAD56823.1 hypothetical protein MBELCI_2875 [Limimaricola cinnabarinus LL-001]